MRKSDKIDIPYVFIKPDLKNPLYIGKDGNTYTSARALRAADRAHDERTNKILPAIDSCLVEILNSQPRYLPSKEELRRGR